MNYNDPSLLPPVKILALNDSPFLQEALPIMLRTIKSCDLDIASTAKEALDLLSWRASHNELYDCVLADMRCPGLPHDEKTQPYGGLQLLNLLRGDDRNKHLTPLLPRVSVHYKHSPVVLFSGPVDQTTLFHASGAGRPEMGADLILRKADPLNLGRDLWGLSRRLTGLIWRKSPNICSQYMTGCAIGNACSTQGRCHEHGMSLRQQIRDEALDMTPVSSIHSAYGAEQKASYASLAAV